MAEKSGIERALELRSELFDIANSFSGEETGNVAILLHEACNLIVTAECLLDAILDD